MYSINVNDFISKIYGISQNPNTKDYIIIQDVYYNGNKKIDNFIQEIQLKRKSCEDIIFEWISYNQFSNVKEMYRGDYATMYSAIWKDGPLYYDKSGKNYKRESDKQVGLKCMHNSQSII